MPPSSGLTPVSTHVYVTEPDGPFRMRMADCTCPSTFPVTVLGPAGKLLRLKVNPVQFAVEASAV